MNTRINKTVLLIILMICLATAVYSAVGTFTFRTSGASDTTEVVDLRYPQKVPEDASVTTDSIADGSITNDKLAEPVSVANGGTGKTTATEALAALGGASLNGSSTVAFNASTINGVVPLTAAEKTQALVGSSTVDFYGKDIFVEDPTGAKIEVGLSTITDTSNCIAINGMNAGSYYIGKRYPIGSAPLVITYGTGPETSSGLMLSVNNIFYIGTCPTHADNAAAIAGGLTAGQVYRTSTGVLMIVYTP
jgi:hypothetical protein